jgi:hypothetical protein
MLTETDRARFERDGFILLKGAASSDEVARLKHAADHIHGAADLSAIPSLESFWATPLFTETAKFLLGEPITFFGEASYHRDRFCDAEHIKGRHLHHDAKGTPTHLFNRQHAPTSGPYPIIRFAVYLQDHVNASGGLKVVPGSHQLDSSRLTREGGLNYFNVPTEPGDCVAFCNKILHSPFALRLVKDPTAALSPDEEDRRFARNPRDFLPTPSDRRAIFVDFAANSELADIFIKGRALNPANARSGFVGTYSNGTLVSDAKRANVGLRLDAAVVEAVTKIIEHSESGTVSDAARPYLKVLPALCRRSQPWSTHFNFIPQATYNDTTGAGLEILNKIAPRIAELRMQFETRQPDKAMLARTNPSLA